MSKADGGPAFPGSVSADNSGGLNHGPPGMTLRDYFAAAAMTGIVSATHNEKMKPETPGEAAHWAYLIADAMLEARKK